MIKINQSRRDFFGQLGDWIKFFAVSEFGSIIARADLAQSKALRGGQCYLVAASGSMHSGADVYHDDKSPPGFVVAWKQGSSDCLKIPVPFTGHGFAQNPVRPSQLATCEKWGKHAALVDLAHGNVISVSMPQRAARFFGHIAYSKDGKLLYISSMDDEKSLGFLSIVNSDTGKYVGEIPSHGRFPHECRLSTSGNEIVVMNASTPLEAKNPQKNVEQVRPPTQLVWISPETGRLIKTVDFKWKRGSLSHFAWDPEGWIVAIGLRHHYENKDVTRGLLAIASPESMVTPLVSPDTRREDFKGETLSMAFLGNSGRVAVTSTGSDLLVVVDYKNKAILQNQHIDQCQGIVSLEDGRIFTNTRTGKLFEVDFEKKTSHELPFAFANGRHLYSFLI